MSSRIKSGCRSSARRTASKPSDASKRVCKPSRLSRAEETKRRQGSKSSTARMRSAIELFQQSVFLLIRTTLEGLASSLRRPGIVISSASTLILLNYENTLYIPLAAAYEPAFPEAVDARLRPCNHPCQHGDRGGPFENLWESEASRGLRSGLRTAFRPERKTPHSARDVVVI